MDWLLSEGSSCTLALNMSMEDVAGYISTPPPVVIIFLYYSVYKAVFYKESDTAGHFISSVIVEDYE